MIVGATYVEGVGAFEPEHNPILVVHTYCVLPFQVPGERVQPAEYQGVPWLLARNVFHSWPVAMLKRIN